MSLKRQKPDDASSISSSPPEEHEHEHNSCFDVDEHKRPSFRNAVLEVMTFCTINKYVEPVLEPLIRRVVREEVELAIQKHITNMKWVYGNQIESCLLRSLQLQFLTALSFPVFTGTNIEGEDCNMLKVALVDAHTGKTVSSGTESAAKVEIVVLEGDFDDNVSDNWTVEEFNVNIVKERRGKKPLLHGNAFLNLNEGIGVVGNLSFTDNSSWTRSRKFRLGARVLDICDGNRVREAKSESFTVRDHRGELYKKHHPPYLSDEVWRLEKISKDGAFHRRLNKEKIRTVKDFLVLFFLDPTRLKHQHRSSAPKRDGVVFNAVGQVLGLLLDGKYIVSDKLSETNKAEAHKLVISAFQNSDKVLSYDDEASLRTNICSFTEDLYHLDTQVMTGNHEGNNSIPKGRFDYPQMNPASPDVSMGDYGLNQMSSIDVRFDQPMDFQCHVDSTLICDPRSSMHLQYIGAQPGNLQCAVDQFLFPCSAMAKAHRRWKFVLSVVKWFLLMLELRKGDIISIAQTYSRDGCGTSEPRLIYSGP